MRQPEDRLGYLWLHPKLDLSCLQMSEGQMGDNGR